MLVLKLTQTKVRAWSGYTANRTGWLPARMSWMQPEAAKALREMQEACGHVMEFTDAYRRVMFQIRCIQGASERKRRLYAPPTKSGHNFGWSVDINVADTLAAFRAAGKPELVSAGQNRHALGLWMSQFGWTGIRSENWHFNHLAGHASTIARIDAEYGEAMKLDNADVQRALNALMPKEKPLNIDGELGTKSSAAAKKADKILGTKDNGAFSAWFRRVLAGATATIVEVDENGQETD